MVAYVYCCFLLFCPYLSRVTFASSLQIQYIFVIIRAAPRSALPRRYRNSPSRAVSQRFRLISVNFSNVLASRHASMPMLRTLKSIITKKDGPPQRTALKMTV